MAKTYYGYTDRDTEKRFNWAESGKKISDAIEKEATSRETRKQDYITANQEWEKSLKDKIPTSKDASLNNQILQGLQVSLDRYYGDYKSFTNGDITENEWIQKRQNYKDGLENYFGLMGDYAKMSDEKMARQQGEFPDAQPWEAQDMSQIQGFNDYSKWQLAIDENGHYAMNKIGEDGEYLEGAGDAVNLSIARKQIGTYYNSYNLKEGVNSAVTRFGETTKAILNAGVYTRSGIKERPEWENSLELVTQSALQNPFSKLSILTMDMKRDMTPVYSEEEAGIDEDGNYKVYMKKSPEEGIFKPVFTTEQDDAIKETFKTFVLNQAGINETAYQKNRVVRSATELKNRKIKINDEELYRRGKEFFNNPTSDGWKSFTSASSVQQLGGEAKVTRISDTEIKVTMPTADGTAGEIILNTANPEEAMEILYANAGGDLDNFPAAKKEHGRVDKISTGTDSWEYEYTYEKKAKPYDKTTDLTTAQIETKMREWTAERNKWSPTDDAYKEADAQVKRFEKMLGVTPGELD